ncbi:Hypothetical predicted protein [Paramuricea clavata]|uniref:Uncharacterized protein n=1 Tax=Paramuricea clavata TaxID=317549 RepID=A0A6S7KFJ6_PARCT|nr:Hypothetical predicted protein [Paramuricea clavata]
METSKSSSDDINFRPPDEPGPSFRVPENISRMNGGKRRGSGRFDEWIHMREQHNFKDNTTFARFLLQCAQNDLCRDNVSNVTEQLTAWWYRRKGKDVTSQSIVSDKPCVNQSTLVIEHLTLPTHNRVFIDSVIRNTSITMQSLHLQDDSDDESVFDESADESGDDVYCESDVSSTSSYDDDDDDNIHQACYLPPEFDQLNISCDKDFLDHENDGIDSTLIEPVDMDTSSTEGLGSIECNIPSMSYEQPDLVEGNDPLTRLLPAGYENCKVADIEEEL